MIGEKFLNAKQAIRLIGVSYHSFRKIKKQLPESCSKVIGGRVYYNRCEIEKYFSK
jgi:hypothetical protein